MVKEPKKPELTVVETPAPKAEAPEVEVITFRPPSQMGAQYPVPKPGEPVKNEATYAPSPPEGDSAFKVAKGPKVRV